MGNKLQVGESLAQSLGTEEAEHKVHFGRVQAGLRGIGRPEVKTAWLGHDVEKLGRLTHLERKWDLVRSGLEVTSMGRIR